MKNLKGSYFKSRGPNFGFSLIELLVVMGIITIVISFALPASIGIMRGSGLTQAAQLITEQVSLARQQALSRNRSIEVRFYKYGDPESPGEDATNPDTGRFRATQCFEISEYGSATPLGKVYKFSASVFVDEGEYSTLISDSSQLPLKEAKGVDIALPGGVERNYKYVAFRFQPDGSTNLPPVGGQANGNWFITLLNVGDEKKEIEKINFFTLQIDPVSGSTKSYRPNAG